MRQRLGVGSRGEPPSAKEYQPMLSDVSLRQAPWSQEVALETIGAHAAQRGPLLPVLHALAEHATRSLGVDFGGTAVDGSVTLDEVFCLGNCALGPTVTVNGRLRGRVHSAELDALVADGGVVA